MKTKLRSRRRAAMKVHQESSIGPRCRSFCAGCITCSSWLHKDRHGFFPRSFNEAYAYEHKVAADLGDNFECTWEEL
jgi:hypothetical protein